MFKQSKHVKHLNNQGTSKLTPLHPHQKKKK